MAENAVYAGFVFLTLGSLSALYFFFVRLKQHRSRTGRWWKVPAGNLLVLMAALSSAGLLGETYYRFWYDAADSFGFTKTCMRWWERHGSVNNMEYRDDYNYAGTISAGKRRVTFIGDSFTAGHGIAEVKDRFANRIRAMHPEWEVHVLAIPGWDSGAELGLLYNLAQTDYQFDQVVLIYCLNDIGDATRELLDQARNTTNRKGSRGFLVDNSYLINTLYYRSWIIALPELKGYFRNQHKDYFGPAWDVHTPRLKTMRDIIQDRGGQLAVVTFPYMHLMGPDYEFKDVDRKLDEYWKSLGVPHLDLYPTFAHHTPGELMVNSFDAHPNELAHSLAAGAISGFLEDLPWLKNVRKPYPPPGSLADSTLDEVAACFRRAAEISLDPAMAHNQLGWVLLNGGRINDAIAEFEKALRINPTLMLAQHNLGDALAKCGRTEEAINRYQKILELQPDDPYVRAKIQRLQVLKFAPNHPGTP